MPNAAPASSLVTDEHLIALLAPSLGRDKSRALLRDGRRALRIDDGPMTQETAMALLESLSAQPGIVGIVAGLARSRLRLGAVSKGAPR